MSQLTKVGVIVGALSNCGTHTVELIPRSVLFGNPEKVHVTVSPDGRKIAYCAPHNNVMNIWVKTIDADDASPITCDTWRGIQHYCWAHDNKHILYCQDNNGDEQNHIYRVNIATKEVKDITPFTDVKVEILQLSEQLPHEVLALINKGDPRFFDVYRINLVEETCVLEVKNPGNVCGWLADNNLVVRAAITINENDTQTLLVRDHNDDAWRSLVTVNFEDMLCEELESGLVAFSADGNSLYINTSIESDTKRLVCMNTMTGTYEEIVADARYDLEAVVFDAQKDRPVAAFWHRDRMSHSVLCDDMKKDVEFICAQVPDGTLSSLSRNHDKTVWIVGFIFDTKSPHYYVYNQTKQTLQFLFSSRPAVDACALSPMKPISYATRDGLTVHGYVTCPRDKEAKNLPLVLFVHGGPIDRDTWGLNSIVQFFANRGIACLQVNYRGSTGYGKKFLKAGDGEWAAKMHDDLIDGVQWAVDAGIADPQKVAIFGGSYGGYAALVGVTFTPDVFCCAVDYVGPSNLITLLQSIPPYWSLAQWEQRIGKLSDEEFLKSRSPLFKVDAIKKPVLIAHGAHDIRVKQAEADQIVEAMKQKGIPHEYLLFSDEGHGLIRPQNRMKFFAAVEAFFAQHLGSACERFDDIIVE